MTDAHEIDLTERRLVLVADDEHRVRELVRTILETDGYEVVQAPDGRSALQLAVELHPEVAIIDLTMSGMSGVELCQRLDTEKTHVIVVTAHDDPDLEVECRDAGASAYLTKPFSSADLTDVLGHLLAAPHPSMAHDFIPEIGSQQTDPVR